MNLKSYGKFISNSNFSIFNIYFFILNQRCIKIYEVQLYWELDGLWGKNIDNCPSFKRFFHGIYGVTLLIYLWFIIALVKLLWLWWSKLDRSREKLVILLMQLTILRIFSLSPTYSLAQHLSQRVWDHIRSYAQLGTKLVRLGWIDWDSEFTRLNQLSYKKNSNSNQRYFSFF